MNLPTRGELRFHRFHFTQHTVPIGCLPNDPRAQACWYYYLLAHKMWENTDRGIDQQILLEGELWMDPKYADLKRTVATIYGFESPSEFEKFWEYVVAETRRVGMPEPMSRYRMAGPDKRKLII